MSHHTHPELGAQQCPIEVPQRHDFPTPPAWKGTYGTISSSCKLIILVDYPLQKFVSTHDLVLLDIKSWCSIAVITLTKRGSCWVNLTASQMEVAFPCPLQRQVCIGVTENRMQTDNLRPEKYKEGGCHYVLSCMMSMPTPSSQLDAQPCGGPDNEADGCGMTFPRMSPESILCPWCKKLMNAVTEVDKERIQVCNC